MSSVSERRAVALLMYPVFIWQGSCLNTQHIAKQCVHSFTWRAKNETLPVCKLCFKVWSRQIFGVIQLKFKFAMLNWFQTRKVLRPVLNQFMCAFLIMSLRYTSETITEKSYHLPTLRWHPLQSNFLLLLSRRARGPGCELHGKYRILPNMICSLPNSNSENDWHLKNRWCRRARGAATLVYPD